MKKRLLALFCALAVGGAVTAKTVGATSPGGNLRMEIEVADKISYTVWSGADKVLDACTLSLTLADRTLGEAPRLRSVKRSSADEMLERRNPTKDAVVRNCYNAVQRIYDKCRRREPLSREEAYRLYDQAPLQELALVADEVRRAVVPDPEVVTWQIDRNVNITNVCISGCRFCNFHCKPHQTDRAFVTTLAEYREKIDRTLELGGDQLLLQGGLHPQLRIDFYERLFSDLKALYPTLRLHALGAPEVAHIARISGLTTLETLRRLMAAGLDSLPGAGAEILDPVVRRAISPAKPSVEKWLDVMHEAHCLGLPTSATMMYGHVETPHQRVDHLLRIRDLQARCPEGKYGFIAFIPWIFRSTDTELERQGVTTRFSPLEYLRIIAVSRLVLCNIRNIQASWLTVGKATAQAALHSGANDMGSIMIEENVVSSAGAHNRFDAEGIRKAIREAGFTPRLRDQLYGMREYAPQA